MIDFLAGGEAVELDAGDECDDEECRSCSRGRGAIGIAISTVRLYAGYPSHCLPDLTHFVHCGRVSSHLTLRFLQLLHPVFTLGLLALLALTVLVLSSVTGMLLVVVPEILFPPPHLRYCRFAVPRLLGMLICRCELQFSRMMTVVSYNANM